MIYYRKTLFGRGPKLTAVQGVSDKAAVVESYFRAKAYGAQIGKPPRTTWRGTPLHELWLRDPTRVRQSTHV